MKKLTACAIFLAAIAVVVYRSTAQVGYIPKAQLCANGTATPCSIVPAYIGPDPELKAGLGYPGLFKPLPKTVAQDVETPFDNMAWQMFVSLNWAANAVNQPASKGLTEPGQRVWQTYRKVSSLFGNSPVTAGCTNALALPVLSIGSDGKGNPQPNNEEYFQASTNSPLIDINMNWAIFERRVNDIEAQYLLAPNGKASQTLTTQNGQRNFIANNPGGVQFTSSSTIPTGNTGSIEIKAAWRILNRNAGDDPSRYYTQNVLLAVPGDLVSRGKQICATATVGLVGMHILQRNPVDTANPELLPEWIWATFEHVDNAPMAKSPCNIDTGCGPTENWLNTKTCGAAAPSSSIHYSFYNPKLSPQLTNIKPVPAVKAGIPFPWNPKPPYAQGATTTATAMPQATRCWSIYRTTAELNTQWQFALAALKSVFRNYKLIGTQWGANVEPPATPNHLPANAVPAMLSNITLETYIQNYTDGNIAGPGSCIGCHSGAPLAVGNPAPSANFSFLPLLADPPNARSKVKTAP